MQKDVDGTIDHLGRRLALNRIAVNTKVYAFYAGDNLWYPATIVSNNQNASQARYTVKYVDDGCTKELSENHIVDVSCLKPGLELHIREGIVENCLLFRATVTEPPMFKRGGRLTVKAIVVNTNDTVRVSWDRIVLDECTLSKIKSSNACIHADNFDVGISERREPTCQSATMNYTSSSPRIKKRTATQQDSNTRITTCGNDDTDGPRAPVKPHSHELSTT
ncbi:hypothetical protein AAVH_28137, partial [Aphelenchoides avenae]